MNKHDLGPPPKRVNPVPGSQRGMSEIRPEDVLQASAGLLVALKQECEKQHHRAAQAEVRYATLCRWLIAGLPDTHRWTVEQIRHRIQTDSPSLNPEGRDGSL